LGNGRGEGLWYALYEPPYGTTNPQAIAMFDEDLVGIIFDGKPKKNWIVFSSTANNDYFINERWDYLWTVFNTEHLEAVVLAATATD